MAITVDFAKKYAHLIHPDLKPLRLQSYPDSPKLPEKYRKQFIHTEDGFVKKFCEDYGYTDHK